METKVELDQAYLPSEEVVARVIEGELIIVPLTSGIGDMEDELFSLNETGRAVGQAERSGQPANDHRRPGPGVRGRAPSN